MDRVFMIMSTGVRACTYIYTQMHGSVCDFWPGPSTGDLSTPGGELNEQRWKLEQGGCIYQTSIEGKF